MSAVNAVIAVRSCCTSCCDAGVLPLFTYCVTAGTTAAANTAMTVTVTRISGSVKPLRRRALFMSAPESLYGERLGNRKNQELQRVDGALAVAHGARAQIAVVHMPVDLQRAQRVVHRHGDLQHHVALSGRRARRPGRQQRVDFEARLE